MQDYGKMKGGGGGGDGGGGVVSWLILYTQSTAKVISGQDRIPQVTK